MAKPRVFISSTFYDLKQIRIELDKFIEGLGYEPVRNEVGDIPYGKDEDLRNYCYKEISNVDILISIIGSRYGSSAITDELSQEYSVSQKELKTAWDEGKQVFVFIENSVFTEYETYLINKTNKDIKYRFVDNPNIYRFIEEIKGMSINNNIKGFDTADDIKAYLKEQFAGLFKQFLLDSKRMKEAVVLRDIEGTAKNLRDLVDYLKQENQEKGEEINKIIMFNHPLIGKLKEILHINYNFYIDGEQDLANLMSSFGFKKDGSNWRKIYSNGIQYIAISDELFNNGKLMYLKPNDWKGNYVSSSFVANAPQTLPPLAADDLPF